MSEEPANQGAWFSHRHRLQRVLDRLDFDKDISMVSRPPQLLQRWNDEITS